MISVVIPTYNEIENIALTIKAINQVLSQVPWSFEIIVVDDSSPDGTAAAAQELTAHYPLRVIVREGSRGLAQAVLQGFYAARGDVLVVMDADLSHPVEKLPEMVRPVIEGECDATVGSRYIPGGGCDNWPSYRIVASRFAGFLAKGLTKLSDPTSGYMAIRKSNIQGFEFNPIGWKIVLEILMKTRVKVVEVPIMFGERKFGKSKLDWRADLQYLAHLFKLYLLKLKHG